MTDAPDVMLQAPDEEGWRKLDAFSDVLRVIRLSGGVFLEAEFTAPWCISGKISTDDCKPFLVPPRHVIASHFVAAGSMQLRVEGGDAIEVRAGEFVLLTHNDHHVFGSDLNVPLMPAAEVIQPPQGGGISRINYGGGVKPRNCCADTLALMLPSARCSRHCRRC